MPEIGREVRLAGPRGFLHGLARAISGPSTSPSARAIRLSVLIVVVLSTACARHSGRYARARVSGDIEKRTGFRLAGAAEPGKPSLPDGVLIDDGVSQDEAVALALWNNAAFQETLADLGFARADLIQAGLLQNPVFSLLFPTGLRHWESTLALSVDALVFLPQRVSIAEIQSKRVGQRLVQTGLDLIRDVRVAYADLALARDRARIGEEKATLLERIAEISEKRLRAGDVSEFEVTTAQINAVSARGDTVILAHDVALAEERLRSLVGYGLADGGLTFENPPQTPPVTQDSQTLVKEAKAARPDFRAAELACEAAARQAGLARWEFLKLDILLDGDEIEGHGFEVGPGFRVPLPIFNRNQDGIARARAELERAVHHQITVRDRIRLEVNQAYTRYRQARENLENLRMQVLTPMERALARAEKAYGNGNISFLLVLETAHRHLDARGREAEAVAALRRARAELERSVGWRLDSMPTHVEPGRESLP